MKTLLIIRHAKSNWDATALNDFERSLNERGKKDAPVMAQRLLDRKIDINTFVSSPYLGCLFARQKSCRYRLPAQL